MNTRYKANDQEHRAPKVFAAAKTLRAEEFCARSPASLEHRLIFSGRNRIAAVESHREANRGAGHRPCPRAGWFRVDTSFRGGWRQGVPVVIPARLYPKRLSDRVEASGRTQSGRNSERRAAFPANSLAD